MSFYSFISIPCLPGGEGCSIALALVKDNGKRTCGASLTQRLALCLLVTKPGRRGRGAWQCRGRWLHGSACWRARGGGSAGVHVGWPGRWLRGSACWRAEGGGSAGVHVGGPGAVAPRECMSAGRGGGSAGVHVGGPGTVAPRGWGDRGYG